MVAMITTFILGALLSIGAPINLIAAINLWKQKKPIGSGNPQAKRRLDLVQRGLNVADIIVIWVYVPMIIARMHVPRFDELLGNFGCKIQKFIAVFGFTAVSNCIVAVSLCRMQTISGLMANGEGDNIGRFRLIMTFPWFVSLICSLPQVFIFNLTHYNSTIPAAWRCGSILNSFEAQNSTFYSACYYIAHETTIFFLPAFFIILINILSAVRLYQLKRNKFNLLCRNQLQKSEVNTSHMAMLQIQARRESISQLVQSHQNLEVHVKMSRSPSLLVLTYLLCWAPYVVVSFVDRSKTRSYIQFFQHTNVLISVLNPILYRFCRSSSALVTLRRHRPSRWQRLRARLTKESHPATKDDSV